jgi:hypothetical protein
MISKLMNYYDSQSVQEYSEAGRAESFYDQYQWEQQVPLRRFSAGLQMTNDSIATMTAEEVAAITQAKLKSFRRSRLNDLKKVLFNNTTTNSVDFLQQYQTSSLPFFNSNSATNLRPQTTDYSYVAGDFQHFNGVATAGTVSKEDIRVKLLDKLAHHGYQTGVELWMSMWDQYLIDQFNDLGIFTPAAETVGRDLGVYTPGVSGTRLSRLSPWEGFQGFVDSTPLIKTPVVPQGYLVAVYSGGGANEAPFLSRESAIPAFNGFKIRTTDPNQPLLNTLMLDAWGFSVNNRAAVAILDTKNTNYTVPAGL